VTVTRHLASDGRRIGLISDTHGLLRPEALAALAGSEVIVHAGDIGSEDVLRRLAETAPVVAVRGNNDVEAWAQRVPERITTELAGVRVHVVHDVKELDIDPVINGVRIVVSGHSHRPRVERRGPVLFVNPGSAGPRRFSLPITVARLAVGPGGVDAEIVDLGVSIPARGRPRA
jgi:putative phosphoesterase